MGDRAASGRATAAAVRLAACALALAACQRQPVVRHLTMAGEAPPRAPGAAATIEAASPRLAMDHCPDFASLVERANPSVVSIFIPDPERPSSRHALRIGTGFVIDREGHVLTNAHVISGALRVRVRLWNNQEYPGEVLGQDNFTDLALLRVRYAPSLVPLEFGDSDRVRVGEWVMAIGTPFGLSHSVTVGVVSARHRWPVLLDQGDQYNNFIQIDAPIHPGNSGGPLLDTRGRVIGISTALQENAPGIGFALPVNVARELIPLLRRGAVINRDWLGLRLPSEGDRDYPSGIPIVDVREDEVAWKVGLRPGDILVSVNDRQLTRIPDLRLLLTTVSAGGDLKLVVRRGNDLRQARIRLIAPEEEEADLRPN